MLVHGIFFRDWQFLGYWGRIPAALETCGAQIYYGKQQSSLPILKSAIELHENLLSILEKSGAEKLNIIAHSKGGLDSRYVISRLGMSDKIASLTTINTPHKGCVFVSQLLNHFPQKIVKWLDKRYNTVFVRLGDTDPDFIGGVIDLRHDTIQQFNIDTPNMPNVYYQSIMSTMRKSRHASFLPLNITWWLSKIYEKELNDGLVSLSSAKWGDFTKHITVKGKRGISHGDMIDLMREDIDEFDVREFYINLVKDLKSKGY